MSQPHPELAVPAPAPAESGAPRSGGLREVFLRRRSSANVDALDGTRAIAVLLVTVYHTWLMRCGLFEMCLPMDMDEPSAVSAMGLLFGHGDLGVDIFFVLSGYLILSILLRALEGRRDDVPGTLGRFLARRLLRIYPALLVTIPLHVLLFYPYFVEGMSGLQNPIVAGCAERWWATALLINNVTSLGGPILPVDGRLACVPWSWSVAIEWQFYLVSPFLVVAYLRSRRAAVERDRPLRWWTGSTLALSLLGVSLACSAWLTLDFDLHVPGLVPGKLDTYTSLLYGNTLTRCPPYLFGMAAAAYRYHQDSRSGAGPQRLAPPEGAGTRWLARWSVFAILVFLVAGAVPFTQSSSYNFYIAVFGRAIFGAYVAYVVAVSAAPRATRLRIVRMLRHPFWVPIARVSYSMYLWQFVGIEAARWLWFRAGVLPYESFVSWLGFAVVGTGLAFLIAIPSYLWVERPAMRLRPAA